ncbi:lasso peptide biosynthesis PqqD family chaperone [Streptomyces sp. SCA3-4]|uniref:lasso peptide biosynthesis PqqD family chaperone n=1 Tax=Streptomyces sichuanensis TaxID=2871810 RepID=UPI001CE3ACDC|nr:lasso peptide biosynthesis PqqD family chaperone [Streptomyces sichuanensis]MCA6093897.1 lasso peptide biosynthesis PqqD family chaperone [Streptomyces sichuanensis]
MTLRLSKHLTLAETDFGAAMLDQRSGKYWQLNPTAAVVARTLLDGGTPEDAVRAVTTRFDVDEARASADVHGLVEAMRAAGVVQG